MKNNKFPVGVIRRFEGDISQIFTKEDKYFFAEAIIET